MILYPTRVCCKHDGSESPLILGLTSTSTDDHPDEKSDKPVGVRESVKGGRHIALILGNFLGKCVSCLMIVRLTIFRLGVDIRAVKW